jgi:hypothetical protein
VTATFSFFSDSGDCAHPLQRERERAGMGEASSGRWGEVDGVNEASGAQARFIKGSG